MPRIGARAQTCVWLVVDLDYVMDLLYNKLYNTAWFSHNVFQAKEGLCNPYDHNIEFYKYFLAKMP